MKRIVWLMVACATLPQCSSASQHLAVPSGDAGQAGAATELPGAGGAGYAGGAGHAGDAGAGPTSSAGKFGQIIVQWNGTRVSGSALFEGGGTLPANAVDPCTTTNVGPCRVQVCDTDIAGPENPQPATAGTVTVAGGSAKLVFTPSTAFESLYDLSSGADATFEAGALLTAAASGAEVPKFDGHAVKLPSAIAVAADHATIPFDRDLVLAWTGGGADGQVVFAIEALGDTQVGSLTCDFAPTAHGGTVPAAALRLLPSCAADTGPICDWTLEPRATVSFLAGEYSIDFSARAVGKSGAFAN